MLDLQKMKEKPGIKKNKTILSLFGLALLLLLSPCKVRNFIQAELDVPPTEVLHKNQTTISATSCVAFDVSGIDHSSSTSVKKALDNFVDGELFTFQLPIRYKTNSTLQLSNSKLIPSIPLYILYQNIQVYS